MEGLEDKLSFKNDVPPDCSLPIVLDDPENDSKEEKHYKEVLSQLFDSNIPESVFLPPLVRPPPPLYADTDDLVWLCPNDNGMFTCDLLWRV